MGEHWKKHGNIGQYYHAPGNFIASAQPQQTQKGK